MPEVVLPPIVSAALVNRMISDTIDLITTEPRGQNTAMDLPRRTVNAKASEEDILVRKVPLTSPA